MAIRCVWCEKAESGVEVEEVDPGGLGIDAVDDDELAHDVVDEDPGDPPGCRQQGTGDGYRGRGRGQPEQPDVPDEQPGGEADHTTLAAPTASVGVRGSVVSSYSSGAGSTPARSAGRNCRSAPAADRSKVRMSPMRKGT